jgi:hypothetical protein
MLDKIRRGVRENRSIAGHNMSSGHIVIGVQSTSRYASTMTQFRKNYVFELLFAYFELISCSARVVKPRFRQTIGVPVAS